MQVTTQYAREHLDELLTFADGGEDIEIAREGQPLAKLIVMPPLPTVPAGGKRILGAGRGIFLPALDDQWQQMKEEDARRMNDAPLMTTGEV